MGSVPGYTVRAVKAVEQFRHDGPVERWRRARDEIQTSTTYR
jgi:hypothetical protein